MKKQPKIHSLTDIGVARSSRQTGLTKIKKEAF
jgi:hypothetical protein